MKLRYDWSLAAESDEMLHLDALRLIASVSVVIYHFRYSLAPVGLWALVPRIAEPFNLFVDLFFTISGYVISYLYLNKIRTPGAYGRFIQKRCARLLPLHWATWGFFVVAFTAISLSHVAVEHPPEWAAVPWQLFLLHFASPAAEGMNVPSWSIAAEMVLYLSFPLLAVLGRRSAWGTLAVSLLLIVALFTWSGGYPATNPRPWYDHTFDGGPVRALPSFLLGMALFRFRSGLAKIPAAGSLMVVVLIAFFAGAALGLHASFLLPLLYAAVVFGIAADQQSRAPRLLSRVAGGGQLTYSIYMLHFPARYFLIYAVGEKVLHLGGIALNMAHVAVFGIVLTAAYLSLVLFERPAREVINGWRLGRGQQAALATR